MFKEFSVMPKSWRIVWPGPASEPNEEDLAFRPHPAILLPIITITTTGLIVATVLTDTLTRHDPARSLFIWGVWGLLLLRLLWKAVEWSFTHYAVGPDRILLYSGVIRRKVTARPLIKVFDISLHRSIMGRALGYGDMRFRSMSQEMPFWLLRYTPYPVQIFVEIYESTFPGCIESGEVAERLSRLNPRYIRYVENI
jgi:hypothetical protein